jgi:hypothetical protein
MNTDCTLKRIMAAALLSGGVAVAGLAVTSGTAQAAPDYCGPQVNGICYGPVRWCPGDPMWPLTQNHVADPIRWDMNACHTYYHVAFGTGNVNSSIWEGTNPPPPPAPNPPPPPGPPPPCIPFVNCLPGL